MWWRVAIALGITALLAVLPARPQGLDLGILKSVANACTTSTAPTVDASGVGSNANFTVTSVATPFSTTSTNDIILAFVLNNTLNGAGSVATVSSISDTSSLTWNRRGTQVSYHSNEAGSNFVGFDIFWAFSAAAQTTDTVTVNWSGTVDHGHLDVVGINGSSSSTPFDPNGSLPASNTSLAAGAPTINVSTTCPATMLIGLAANSSNNNNGNNSVGAGYTLLFQDNFSTGGVAFLFSTAEQQAVTSTQSGTAVNFGVSWPNWLIYADAVRGH